MNRTIKDATVWRYQYGSHDELRRHLQLFLDAYNFGRRLKTLRGLTLSAPKSRPLAGIPPITPSSAVNVIRSVIFSSLATAAIPSGNLELPRCRGSAGERRNLSPPPRRYGSALAS